MSELEFLTVLGLGFLLGARHALDADHVAAVSTILSDRPNLRASGFIGFCWGFGHTAVLLLVGLAVILLKITIPERVAVALEFGLGSIVGMMLLGVAISVPLVLSASCGRRAQEAVQALASLGSIGLGAAMMVRIGLAVV